MSKIPVMIIISQLLFASMEGQEVTVGVFIHAPHVFKNISNEPYGPAVEYIKNMVTAMGYKPNIQLLPLSRILSYLKSGNIDISLELLKTEDREEFLFYPAHPTYTMVQSVTVLSTNKLHEIKSINDLNNMKVGYLFGANIGSFLASSSSIQFELVSGDDWIQKNLAKLLSGRIDAALDNNAYSYLAEAKKQGVDDRIKTLPLPGQGTEFYVVFSKKSSRGFELVNKYNDIVQKGLFNEQIMIEEFLEK